MIEFDKCCFCIPLRTGCLILGYIYVIASIILAVITIVPLAKLVSVIQLVVRLGGDRSAFDGAIAISVITLILVIVLLAFSIILVVGLHKERHRLVKAYLIYYLIFIILSAIIFVVNLATKAFDLGYTISTIIGILMGVYYFLVIRSHWVIMKTID